MKRYAGILMSVTSLPSKYGIGCFDQAAYDFVDWLEKAGQRYWQILPLGSTSHGGSDDSPYQAYSAFAGNPYFIDLEQLTAEGYLTVAECREADCGGDGRYIDYEAVYRSRFAVLRKAYERWKKRMEEQGEDPETLFEAELCQETREYCLYAAVKRSFGEISWDQWEEPVKLRKEKAMEL